MMFPECALAGTVTSRPEPRLRRREPGDLRLMRAPGVRGKATTIPALRPLPAISSVPPIDTWCGLLLQVDAGVQRTLVMRTEVTCAVGVMAKPRARPATGMLGAVGAPPPDAVPPELAASASGAPPTSEPAPARSEHSDAAAAAAAGSVNRLWAPVLAKRFPSRLLSPPDGGVRG